MSIVDQRESQQTKPSSVINEVDNENSSMLMPLQSDGQATDLMGSHLVNNIELYPQTDCMIFQTPSRIGY